MSLPTVVDIAIGLILIYLTLSLLVSGLQEVIATILQRRAVHLRRAIRNLLSVDEERERGDANALLDALYSNVLLQSVNQDAKGFFRNILGWLFKQRHWFGRERLNSSDSSQPDGYRTSAPSYLASETFATSLLDVLRIKDLTTAMRTESNKISWADVIHDLQDFNEKFKQAKLKIAQFRQENSSQLARAEQELADLKGNSVIYQKVQELGLNAEAYFDRLPKSVTSSLKTLVDRAQIKATEKGVRLYDFQQEIETWFNRSMDRASGVYRRNSQGVAFLLGLLIALVGNVDSLHIVGQLAKEADLRQVLTQGAITLNQRHINNTQANNQAQATAPGPAVSPVPAPANPAVPAPAIAPAASPIPAEGQDVQVLVRDLQEANQVLNQVSLPVGWDSANVGQQICSSVVPENAPNPLLYGCPPTATDQAGNRGQSIWSWLKMLAGWLLSAAAIYMGAPFWFEALGRLINVRGTGAVPKSDKS